MDLPAYSLSNNAQDQGKGQVDTDRPAARVGYSTVYFREQPVSMPVVPAWAQRRAPRSRARRLWARFSHWFMLYLILVLVIFFTFKDLRNLSLAVRKLFLPGHSGLTTGDREVHLPPECVEVVDWESIDGLDRHRGFHYVAKTSVDLPVSSELLYLTSHGHLSRGTVQFIDTGASNTDTASIDIAFHYDDEDFSDLLKVCRLHREESKNGVGIFSPQWTHGRGRSHVDVVVKLPPSAAINSLQTQLSNFAQDVGDFRNSVTFDSISLGSTNGHIDAKYLAANRTRLQTTNAHVSGVFNNTHRIEVHTTNGAVDGEFNLSRGDQPESTPASGIVIKTTNGHIKADVSLATAPNAENRGFFNVDTQTSNGRLDINFKDAPVLSHLIFKGRTTNAYASAALHETYEGSYSLSTSRSEKIALVVDDKKKDPAGKGRKRRVTRRVSKRGHVDGNVVWDEVGGKRSLGFVELTTTNGPVQLNL